MAKKRKQTIHFLLAGKRFRYLPKSRTQYYGYCSDPFVSADKRFIAIGKKCEGKPQLELDTLIHEMLHALAPFPREDWGKDHVETWVNDSASDIAIALWRLGYRKQDTDDKTEQTPEEGGQ
jgi:hypothetical protein